MKYIISNFEELDLFCKATVNELQRTYQSWPEAGSRFRMLFSIFKLELLIVSCFLLIYMIYDSGFGVEQAGLCRLELARLRYRSYVVFYLKSSIYAIPECLLS